MADSIPDPAPAEAEGAPAKRRTIRTVLLAVAAVAVLAFAIWLFRYETRGKYVQSTNDAYLRADAVTVSPKVGGYVEALFVRDNQDVRAGQPLLRIDARDYDAEVARTQAGIASAASAVDLARAGVAEQRAVIQQAQAELASATSAARFADAEVARYAPLAASGAETRERLATLTDQAARARSAVAAARAALAVAERRIASLQAQVGSAQAQGAGARAQLAAANVNLGSTVVRASVSGRVGNRSVRVGQFLQPGTRTMSLVPLSGLYVVANFKETQVGRMRIGQPATIEVDALPGVELRGHVESLSPGTGAEFSLLPPQNATGNFTKIVQRVPVRIALDAGPEARKVLVPGLSVEVSVDTIAAKGAQDRIADEEERRR